jgi:hypothetical protein
VRTADAALACLIAACGACGSKEAAPESSAEPKREPASKTQPARARLDTLAMTVPDGWSARYDADGDTWWFESAPLADGRTARAIFERAPRQVTAGPEALRHHMETRVWDAGTTATIERRKGLRDGFAVTFIVRAATDPEQTRREVQVVRELGSEWFRCMSMSIPSEELADQVVALCTSVKRA